VTVGLTVPLPQRLRDHASKRHPDLLRNGLWGRGTVSPTPARAYSLRNPGTSMSSSLTRSLRMSVSSAEIRGRLS